MPEQSQPINAGLLSAQNLVAPANQNVLSTPAVDALADSFRKGFVTMDDILSKIGPVGQAKKKAELQSLQEYSSPEQIEARKLATREAVAKSKLGEAQATAGVPLTAPQAKLAQSQMELQQAALEYGPGVQYFLVLAGEAGITNLPAKDGKPDYAQWASIGTQLYQKAKEREMAKTQLQVDHWQPTADGTALIAFNKEGTALTPETRAQLSQKVNQPLFQSTQPGKVMVQPRIADEAPRMIEQSGGAATGPAVSATPAAAPTPNASFIAAKSSTPVAGSSISGLGISLGPKTLPASPVKMVSEQQKTLAQAEFTKSQVKQLADSFQSLSKNEPWLTGPVLGRLTAFTHPENWNTSYGEFKRAQTAILANLAKGIYHETGVLSDKDIDRYQKTLPSEKDTPPVAQAKLLGLQKDIFSSIVSNIETMKGQGQNITPLVQSIEDSAKSELSGLETAGPVPTGTPAAISEPTANIPGIGTVRRGSDGKYYRVQ